MIFHHILALVSRWNVTTSCQDIKPVRSQLKCGKKKNKNPFKKSFGAALLLDKPSAGSPGGEPGKARLWTVFHLLQAPPAASFLTARHLTSACLSARPHLKAAVKSLIPCEGQSPEAPETAAHG